MSRYMNLMGNGIGTGNLDYPQHRDLNYKSTSYIKVGSVLYQNSTLPFSVLKSGEKIETFPKGFIAKQLLEYRPIPW